MARSETSALAVLDGPHAHAILYLPRDAASDACRASPTAVSRTRRLSSTRFCLTTPNSAVSLSCSSLSFSNSEVILDSLAAAAAFCVAVVVVYNRRGLQHREISLFMHMCTVCGCITYVHIKVCRRMYLCRYFVRRMGGGNPTTPSNRRYPNLFTRLATRYHHLSKDMVISICTLGAEFCEERHEVKARGGAGYACTTNSSVWRGRPTNWSHHKNTAKVGVFHPEAARACCWNRRYYTSHVWMRRCKYTSSPTGTPKSWPYILGRNCCVSYHM